MGVGARTIFTYLVRQALGLASLPYFFKDYDT